MTHELVGKTLGHFRITGRLGEGGMGTVYRAHDERLDCDVAIKVPRPDDVADARARALLFREARNAAALQHSNICSVREVDESDGILFIAMEFVAGAPLAKHITAAGLPAESVIRYGAQIADALAHAHDRGVVHRDLKGANVMITPEGQVKVLDFGVARRVAPEDGSTDAPTRSTLLAPGEAAGTLAYMAPEVLRGEPADRRSDLWSLGVLLHEMASGQHPFPGKTEPELTAKVQFGSPAPLPAHVPAGLRAVIARCLAKDPTQRYQRAGEVRAALELVLTTPDAIPPEPHTPPSPPRRRVKLAAALAVSIAAASVLGWFVWPHVEPALRDLFKRAPTLTQLTSATGAVGMARFAPDGRTFVYTADWDGAPYALYSARAGSAESVPLGLEKSWLLAISPAGELAILRSFTVCPGPYAIGTLALTSLVGGAPRRVRGDVEWVDWSPDGGRLAVVYDDQHGKFVLEYPVGKKLHETSGWITHPRVSRDGDEVAFIEHPVESVYGGSVVVVDTAGRRRTLAEGWKNAWGLAWSPDGREVWFTGLKSGAVRALYAVSLKGRLRGIHGESSDLVLMDVHPDGRALFVRQTTRTQVVGLLPGDPEPREIPGLDYPLSISLSADGSAVLVQEVGAGGKNPEGSMYLVRARRSEKVRLGAGEALALSPDGAWVLAKRPGPEPAALALVPTGPGEPRPLPRDSLTRGVATWFPDGRRFVFAGFAPGHGARTYAQSLAGGPPEPITPEGAPSTVLSPDGRWIAVPGRDTLYSTVGEPPRYVPDLADAGIPLAWTSDGKALLVEEREPTIHTVFRFDLATGDRELVREIIPPEEAGVVNMYNTLLTPDGKHYVYTYERSLCDLFLFEGLR